MESHKYEIIHKIIFQYNQIEILMEKNGKKLCTGNPRHIDIHYFFVMDSVDSDTMSSVHCSKDHMLADLFTKPLQGALFLKFCEGIMGWKHVDILQMGPSSTKEYVGNMDEIKSRK